MRRTARSFLAALLLLLAAGCARGPDEAGLKADLQSRLDALFGRSVLVLRDLRRQGSAPYAATDDGARRAIVYFNAALEFVEAYDPSDWEGLSPKLIASALGATDEGVFGLQAGSMAPGSRLRVYGSMVYRRDADEWRPADPSLLPAQGAPAQLAPADQPRADLIRQIAEIVVPGTGGLEPRSQRVIGEELDRALQNMRLRLDEGAARVVVAAGPTGGEYARFMASLSAHAAEDRVMEIAHTEGSVANALMIEAGRARFAIVQSDVAAAAVTGDGVFAGFGPLRQLRAVASLFPEPMHVVVRRDSGIEDLTQLAGRRVSLGAAGSGTRHTALRVLEAHGLGAGAYEEVAARDPSEALAQLEAGALDAVIAVASAPWDQLTKASRTGRLRLLGLDETVVEQVQARQHGVVPLWLPARTYGGQEQPVRTVASTALLVARADTTDAAVERALEMLFGAEAAERRGVLSARLSRRNALVGVTIPLHEGAARYFESGESAGGAPGGADSSSTPGPAVPQP